MEKYLEKAYEAEKTIFNGSIHILKQIDMGIHTGYEGENLSYLYEAAYYSGAFGSWIKYSDKITYHRIILNKIGAYMASIKDNQLTDIEYTKAFFDVIQRNINSGIFTENAKFLPLERANRLTQFEIQEILNNSNCQGNYFIPFVESFFTKMFLYPKLYEKEDNELFLLLTVEIEDIKTFIDCHRIIKEHYLDKQDSFNNQDIQIIIDTLIKLELEDESISKIKKGLEALIYRRNSKQSKQEKKNESSNIEIKKVQYQPKELLSKKEYYALEKELETYFNIKQMLIIKPLSLKEVIYCIRIMLKLQKPDYIIDTFIRLVEKKNNSEKKNPLSLYIELYDKINYYAENEDIKRRIELIEEYFQEIFICSSDDYEFWKSMIDEELSTIQSNLPTNGEYEIEEAKKLK